MRLLLIILCLGVANVRAQVYDSLSTQSVKIDLLSFADNFPSLMLSYEHKLLKGVYLHHEAGLVLPVENYQGYDVSGFKLREEIRKYVVSWGVSDFYIGLDGRYTQERITDNVVLGYQCTNEFWWEECQFYKNVQGVYLKELLAFDLRMGLRHSIYPLFFEYDLGYGYGKDYVSDPDIELTEGYEIRSDYPFNLRQEDWKILLSLRAKLGYYINKKPYRKN